MEENKVTSISVWSEADSVKELQQFLGFANFYRHYIQGFSSVVETLTDILEGNKKGKIRFTAAAHDVFNTLKQRFTSAPILKIHNPN